MSKIVQEVKKNSGHFCGKTWHQLTANKANGVLIPMSLLYLTMLRFLIELSSKGISPTHQ